MAVKTTSERVMLAGHLPGVPQIHSSPFPCSLYLFLGELTPKNYISQVPLLTGFLSGSANGRPQWEFGGGRKTRQGISPRFFAAGSGLSPPWVQLPPGIHSGSHDPCLVTPFLGSGHTLLALPCRPYSSLQLLFVGSCYLLHCPLSALLAP